MVLGTGSHVGKTTLVAGLGRLLAERGFRVAPFKAQNMSLNSWITRDGGEMGVAQAVQAWACGVEPRVEMNPVLLKPRGDGCSQVVLMGRPWRDVRAREYYQDAIGVMQDAVRRSLEALSQDFEVIIIEGAGGAAEINLYHRDIVNIGIARLLRPPVILVGDIERGGVFASIYGTLELLPEDVRSLVVGVVINKFRGDLGILEPGLRQLEELTGVPVLGVLPYQKLGLPSEDSVSLEDKSGVKDKPVTIDVLRFPHISNFTDFEPLEPYANVRYVELEGELVGDAVILPGTKNTVDDLVLMREKGMDVKVKQAARRGVPVIGICGGYQMLGREIVDLGVEGMGRGGKVEGLGLLDAVTVFSDYSKRTVQVEKPVTGGGEVFGQIQGEFVRGYEIHMGKTFSRGRPAFGDDGCVGFGGMVWGSYLHGLFENRNLRQAFLGFLYKRKGLEFREGETDDRPYVRLAELLEKNLDVEKILSLFHVF